jgi:hypothetical protein
MGMVIRAQDDNRFLLAALAASLGLHLLIALVLPLWTPAQSDGLQPVEALSFARIIHVQMQRPAPAAQPVAVPDTAKRAQKISFARHRSELTAKTAKPQARPTALNGPTGPLAAAPQRIHATRPAPLYAQAPASSMPVSISNSTSSQTPQPEATVDPRAADGTGTTDRGGVLPFGAAQDPVLDPAVRVQLAKLISVHVTLVVTVGEDGHTKHITFQPPLDPQTERDVESVLSDATWDAAVCGGGVSCEGVATIKL